MLSGHILKAPRPYSYRGYVYLPVCKQAKLTMHIQHRSACEPLKAPNR